MIDCRQAVSRMWAYLSREPDVTDAELEQHLGTCLRCCGELEFTRQLRSRLAGAERHTMPVESRTRIGQLLNQVPLRR
jgi:hypothetical protein